MLPMKRERMLTSWKGNADETLLGFRCQQCKVVSNAKYFTGRSCPVLGRALWKYLSKRKFCVPFDSVPLGVFSRERFLKYTEDAHRKAVCGGRELQAAYAPVHKRTGNTSDSDFDGAASGNTVRPLERTAVRRPEGPPRPTGWAAAGAAASAVLPVGTFRKLWRRLPPVPCCSFVQWGCF